MIRVNGSKTNVGRQLLVKNNKGWSFCDHIIRIQFEVFCLPNYMVLKEDTINQIVRMKPKTKYDLLKINGIGEKTVEKYGNEILSIVNK